MNLVAAIVLDECREEHLSSVGILGSLRLNRKSDYVLIF